MKVSSLNLIFSFKPNNPTSPHMAHGTRHTAGELPHAIPSHMAQSDRAHTIPDYIATLSTEHLQLFYCVLEILHTAHFTPHTAHWTLNTAH